MTKLQTLEPYNLFTSDPVLGRAVEREGGAASHDDLVLFGDRVGSEEVYQWGFDANRYSPELLTHDRFGERIDEIRFALRSKRVLLIKSPQNRVF